MYLSIHQCENLDAICNRFEVSLRSYVADTLLNTFQYNESNIRNNLNKISLNFKIDEPLLPINTAKYIEKAKFLLSLNLYELLKNSNASFVAKEIIAGDVIAVGQLVDTIVLLFNPAFLNLSKDFENHEELIEYLVSYQKTRNNLAHPASAKITKTETEKVFSLIHKVSNQIDEVYFWYSRKDEILKLISDLNVLIHEDSSVRHNLDMVPKKHDQLILRNEEMDKLLKYFYGISNIGKKSSSVELHGYGGVGKSALSIDFCYEILRREENNDGQGYSFILWLSNKTEELSYETVTGKILINNFEPTYANCSDIVMQLIKILKMDSSTSKNNLFQTLFDQKISGIIVLDNFESLNSNDKVEISKLIKEIPAGIQFLITSRNFEGISSDNIEVKGFSEISVGKLFISQFCDINVAKFNLQENQKELLIKYSYGNTLILVLCLQRILDGIVSIDSIINDLQLYQNNEIEIIADFMYKNTFNNTIEELENEGLKIDIKNLLRIILIYDEGIDFSSLQELLDYPESRTLEIVLSKLVHRFILVKSQSYYELHDFAKKFIILKLLPDQIQLKKLDAIISNYKKVMKENLQRLYEDKKTYAELAPILDDWKAVTSTETVAITQAYTEYYKVMEKLWYVKADKLELNNLINEAREDFKRIELRSFHPYIKFQKGRVLSSILREQKIFDSNEKIKLSKEVIGYYEEAYISIKLKHNYLTISESYAAFLSIYGIQLSLANLDSEALKMYEEAEMKFCSLKNFRNPINAGNNSNKLAEEYAYAFLKTEDYKYLENLTRSINNAEHFYKLAGAPFHNKQQLNILLAFRNVCLNSYRTQDIYTMIDKYSKCPPWLRPIYRAIQDRMMH